MGIEAGNPARHAPKPAHDGRADAAVLFAGDAERLVVPFDNLILVADYARAGSDLVLTGPDGTQVVIVGYFDLADPPALVTEIGAVVAADLVALLAGPMAPGQYAQAGDQIAQALGDPVGEAQTVKGSVTVIHADGTRVTAVNGTPIYQNDIIETTGDGSVGILFVDDSTLAISNNGRVIVNEMVYDPSTQDGRSVLSVLQGAFVAVSGQIGQLHPENVAVRTPVGTIGIRGTEFAGDFTGPNGVIGLLSGQIFIETQGTVLILDTVGNAVQIEPNGTITRFEFTPAEIEARFGEALAAQQGIVTRGNTDDTNTDDDSNPGDVNPGAGGAGGDSDTDGQTNPDGQDAPPPSGENQPPADPPPPPPPPPPPADTTGPTNNTGPSTPPTNDRPDTTTQPPNQQPQDQQPQDQPVIWTGTPGDDTFSGGPLDDILDGGGGDDTLNGLAGDDIIFGGNGDDLLHGGTGNDILDGGNGDDRVHGDDGDDFLVGGSGVGDDVLDGGAERDTVSYVSAMIAGVTVDLAAGTASGDAEEIGFDTLIGIENATGSNHDDILIGNGADNVLLGLNGNDSLDGGAGDDYLFGGEGNDTVSGEAGADYLTDDAGNDTLIGGAGNDTLIGGAGNDTLIGGAGIDLLTGGAGDDVFFWEFAADGVFHATDTVFNGMSDRILDTSFDPGDIIGLLSDGAGTFSNLTPGGTLLAGEFASIGVQFDGTNADGAAIVVDSTNRVYYDDTGAGYTVIFQADPGVTLSNSDFEVVGPPA